ncbi:hypothetical protein HAX54_043903, partial [Datura stramonium]|nr:hypothetical protein [Datura stramonium]
MSLEIYQRINMCRKSALAKYGANISKLKFVEGNIIKDKYIHGKLPRNFGICI